MKILVVDDELVSRKKMGKIMESFGECVTVDSGRAALSDLGAALTKKEPFDLITLDVSMPEMDGVEVLSEIRRMEKERNIPKEMKAKVIMVTAQSDKSTILACIKAGCDNYVVKPFDRPAWQKNLRKSE